MSNYKYPEFKTFGYLPNMYPYEYAPEMDRDEHFIFSCLNPINMYIKAIGLNTISRNLYITVDFF